MIDVAGENTAGKTVTLHRRLHNLNAQNQHYHHHLHTA